MSAQDRSTRTATHHPIDLAQSTTDVQFPLMDYQFDSSHITGMNFDSDLNQPGFGDGSIMWGGMEELALDKTALQQKWSTGLDDDVFGQQAPVAHIEQYGQITPPTDDSPMPRSVKLEDGNQDSVIKGPGQPQGIPPAAPSRRKRSTAGRKAKERPSQAEDSLRKTTRKARKGYKAMTKEEEEDDLDGEIKRERFLERNRVAASKCREKKKEWTNGLESHARELAAMNAHLNACALSLKEEVLSLKSECLKHADCNCSRIREYLDRSIAGMNPSNALGMALPARSSDRTSSFDSNFTRDSAASPLDNSSHGTDSRRGSADADQQTGNEPADSQITTDQDLQALLGTSLTLPAGAG